MKTNISANIIGSVKILYSPHFRLY